MRKILLVFTLISILCVGFIYSEENWEEYKKEHYIPKNTPYESVGGLKFNKKIFEDKNIIVYGDYSLISERMNDFKKTSTGYYIKSGERGEYRYHGYTYHHEYVSNNDFPRDKDSKTKVEEKKWIIMPWDKNSYAYNSYKYNYGSTKMPSFNKLAMNHSELASQINNGLNFSIENSTFTGFDEALNKDPINYVAVDNWPSCWHTGQGMMFHKSNYGDSGHGAWYQTVPIKKVHDKKILEVTAALKEKTVNMNEDGSVSIYIRCTAKLEDEFIYNGSQNDINIKKQIHFNREDIEKWTFEINNDITNTAISLNGVKTSENTAEIEYRFTIDKKEYTALLDENNAFDINIKGKAICQFIARNSNGDPIKSIGYFGNKLNANGLSGIKKEENEKLKVDINAPKEILDKWAFGVKEDIYNSDLIKERYVEIDGIRISDSAAKRFLEGRYKFPERGYNRLYNYTIVYIDKKGVPFHYSSYVLVYTSVPRVRVIIDNPAKVNRRVILEADTSINSEFLLRNSAVRLTEFKVYSDVDILYDINAMSKKEFLVKEEGIINVRITVTNDYASKTYIRKLYIGKDYKPDIIAMLWNNNVVRNEKLNLYFKATSLDGDEIKYSNYEIYYDKDDDGKVDTLVHIGEDECKFKPQELGYYQIVFKVKEDFNNTIEKYIIDSDKLEHKVIRDFFVDNLRPMTKVYIDKEYEFPKADILFLLDKNILDENKAYIKEHKVKIENEFRKHSIMANINILDTNTYVYDKKASIKLHTHTTYPPSIYSYNKDGYVGNLMLNSFDNYPYDKDVGTYQITTDKKEGLMDVENTVSIYYRKDGSHDHTDYSYGMEETPVNLPYSDEDGYKGIVFKDIGGSTMEGNDKEYYDNNAVKLDIQYWVAHYKGVVSKINKVWVPNIQTVNDYIGYYSGIVRKYVKQDNKLNFDLLTNKYIVYITSSDVNAESISDFTSIKSSIPDCKTYIISTKDHSLFDEYLGSDIKIAINMLVDKVRNDNLIYNGNNILINETFDLKTFDIDPEKDEMIIDNPYNYVHDKYYFDNPMSYEQDCSITFDEKNFTNVRKKSFSNPGKYEIYRRIKDRPIGKENKGMYSNISALELFVHRKPVAEYTLEKTYNVDTDDYTIHFIDKSYDPDFEEDINRGIAKKKFKYATDNDIYYSIPKTLKSGVYNIEYAVMDTFGVWSDIKRETLVLKDVPDPELMASLKAESEDFSINDIPFSENLIFYDMKTKYIHPLTMSYQWFYKGKSVSEKILMDSTDKVGEVEWSDYTFSVPKYSDGEYQIKIYLEYDDILVERVFDVIINTPIIMDVKMPKILNDEKNQMVVKTNKYVDEVKIIMYLNTPYEREYLFKEGLNKEFTLIMDSSVEDNTCDYKIMGIIKTKREKIKEIIGSIKKVGLSVRNLDLKGSWNYWNGKTNIFGKKLSFEPHRFLSLEEIVLSLDVKGKPDEVLIDLSDEIKAMEYHSIKYKDLFGYTVDFPKKLESENNSYTFKYILPLADSTKDFNDKILKSPYFIKIILKKGDFIKEYIIDDIDITGNTLDHVYLQP